MTMNGRICALKHVSACMIFFIIRNNIVTGICSVN